jgi:hypothetical protein
MSATAMAVENAPISATASSAAQPPSRGILDLTKMTPVVPFTRVQEPILAP